MAQTYPPPPWRLAGKLVIAGASVPLAAARALVPDPLRLLPAWPGRSLALLYFGLYGEGSTLRYGELAAMVGPVLAGARPGGLVTSIWVDSERSVAGGRELWSLPKQLAGLRWRSGAVAVHDAAGAPIAAARWTEPRVRVPAVAAVPFLGALDGLVRRAWLAGAFQVAPVRVELEVPGGSPLAAL